MTEANKFKCDKNCNVCKKSIDFKKERWCVLSEFNGQKFINDGYYHVECFRNHFMDVKRYQMNAEEMMRRANNILAKTEEII